MSSIGAELVAGGIQHIGNYTASGVNVMGNAMMQEDAQQFDEFLARRSHEWSAREAQKQRDWQTNANKIAMDFNADQAQIQREFERDLANTAYQRQVSDLQAAGLNPMLAYMHSNGADTPSGASASGVASGGAAAGGASSGRSSGGHIAVGNMFEGVARMVDKYFSNAHEISMKADQYQHELDMQDRKQAHEIDMFNRRQEALKERYKSSNDKSYDTDEFFKASMNRSPEDFK